MLSPATCGRLATQGYDPSDPVVQQVTPWLRLAPALCATFMGLGTALRSPWILGALGGTALVGALAPFHPFDLLYNAGIRRLTGGPPLPPSPPPRRFACVMATVWLSGTAWAFVSGHALLGYALGAILTSVAALVATTDICVPSLLYRLMARPGPS